MPGPVFTTASDQKHRKLLQVKLAQNTANCHSLAVLLRAGGTRQECKLHQNLTVRRSKLHRTLCIITSLRFTIDAHLFLQQNIFYEVSLHARNVVKTLSADDTHCRGELRPANARAASTAPPPSPGAPHSSRAPPSDTNLSFIT